MPSTKAQKSFLLQLPLELIYNIVAEDTLLKKDLKNLRLTHHTLATALCPIFFLDIVLDFNRFKIFSSPAILVSEFNSEPDSDSGGEGGDDPDGITEGSAERPINGTPSNKPNIGSLEERLATFRAEIAALENGSLSSGFFDAVQSFTIDTTRYYFHKRSVLIVEAFSNYEYNVTDFISWFSNLKSLRLNVHLKGDSNPVVKLLKGVLRKRAPAGVEVFLRISGIHTHRACLQKIQNVSKLYIEAQPSRLDSFCQDISKAIAASPRIHTVELFVYPNYAAPRYRHLSSTPFININAIFKGVPTSRLMGLKHLKLHIDLMSPSGSDLKKLGGLEELSVQKYLLPNTESGVDQSQSVKQPHTIWDHLRSGGVTVRKLEVKMIDETFLRYLESTIAQHIETLNIHVGRFRGGSDHAEQLARQFWCELIPLIAPNLKCLKVTSGVTFDGKSLAFQAPHKLLVPDQAFPNLQEVALGFAYKKPGAVSNILAFLRSAHRLKNVMLNIDFMAVYSTDNIKGKVTQGNARSRFKRKIATEIDSGVGDSLEIILAEGAVLRTNLYFRDSKPAVHHSLSMEYISRSGDWIRK